MLNWDWGFHLGLDINILASNEQSLYSLCNLQLNKKNKLEYYTGYTDRIHPCWKALVLS